MDAALAVDVLPFRVLESLDESRRHLLFMLEATVTKRPDTVNYRVSADTTFRLSPDNGNCYIIICCCSSAVDPDIGNSYNDGRDDWELTFPAGRRTLRSSFKFETCSRIDKKIWLADDMLFRVVVAFCDALGRRVLFIRYRNFDQPEPTSLMTHFGNTLLSSAEWSDLSSRPLPERNLLAAIEWSSVAVLDTASLLSQALINHSLPGSVYRSSTWTWLSFGKYIGADRQSKTSYIVNKSSDDQSVMALVGSCYSKYCRLLCQFLPLDQRPLGEGLVRFALACRGCVDTGVGLLRGYNGSEMSEHLASQHGIARSAIIKTVYRVI